MDCCYPSQVILTAITEHSWCLKLFLQLVNSFLFDFPCIRGFHEQEWCVLYKSIITSSLFGFLIPKKLLMSVFDKLRVLYLKARSVDSLGKWSYSVLVKHALSNVYLHFFSLTLISLTGPRDYCRMNLQLFSTTIDFRWVTLSFHIPLIWISNNSM